MCAYVYIDVSLTESDRCTVEKQLLIVQKLFPPLENEPFLEKKYMENNDTSEYDTRKRVWEAEKY